jgi:hypothetical protein
MLAQPVSAASITMSYSDNENDLSKFRWVTSLDPYNYVIAAPWPANSKVGKVGYCDIESASLTFDGESYVFEMKMAQDLPSNGLIPGVNTVFWGFPMLFSADFNDALDVWLQWDGEDYQALVQDSRPIMGGGNWEYTSIPYEVKDDKLTLKVNDEQFDIPPDFVWFFRVVLMTATFDVSDFRGGQLIIVDLTDSGLGVCPPSYPRGPWLSWP